MQEYNIEYWNMHRDSHDRAYYYSSFLADDIAHAVDAVYLLRVAAATTDEINGVFAAHNDRVTMTEGGELCFAA